MWRAPASSLTHLGAGCRVFLARALPPSSSSVVSAPSRSFASGAGEKASSSSGQRRSQERVRLMLDTKVSESGTADALFQECIDAVRERRAELELDPVYQQRDTGAITKLKQDELELTRKIFQRIDPSRDVTSDLVHGSHDIDPYWSPFRKVRDLKEQVSAEFDEFARADSKLQQLKQTRSGITAEFDEYSSYATVAEQKRVRIQIKKSLKRCANVYNPYSRDFRNWHGREVGDQMPKPFRLPDRNWEPNPLQVRLARERITWRDVDIIQHFIADNGYILPRRTTMLSRKQQTALVKAVKIAQRMSLLPYKWKLQDYQVMPLMDPLQWTVDRLTERWVEHRDKRSRAMLQVLMERNPELNYRNFLRHEAGLAQASAARGAGPAASASASSRG